MEDATSQSLVQRMMEAVGAKNDSALAQALGITPQALYGAKKKGAIPPAWVMNIAEKNAVSLDWLYFGTGNMYRTGTDKIGPGSNASVNKDVLLEVIEVMEEFLITAKKSLPPKAKAELVYQLYMLVIEEESGSLQPVPMFRLIQGALAANDG